MHNCVRTFLLAVLVGLQSRCTQRHIVSWVRRGVELLRKEVAPCLSVSSSSWSLITRMCAYSNEFCSGHPLANQVPSALALSHKLETDVLGRAEVQESVDIVSPGFFDMYMSFFTPPQEAQPQDPISPHPFPHVRRRKERKRWLSPTCHPHLRE